MTLQVLVVANCIKMRVTTLFCEGVSPKKSLVKIGEPSHTRRLTWWELEGAKNTPHSADQAICLRPC
jgi:hypothetical protein